MCAEISDTKSWIDNRIKRNEITKYMDGDNDFINDEEITEKLENNKCVDTKKTRDILAKSMAVETLTPEETAILLNVNDKDTLEEMASTAAKVKKKVYDNRIVTFAPLYLGNLCVNSCLYCGFRKENKDEKRRVLTLEEVKKETEVLAGKIGHKRLIVVCGEHPATDIDYMTSSIKQIYKVKVEVKGKNGYGSIRRVNMNAAPLSIENLKKLKGVGIGTFQVFQETYHHKTYQEVHPSGTIKSDYRWRLYCMHRSMEAGIDDVGIGALFGLYDWKFEVMGLLYHARELEEKFGIGPHTISFPRLEPASNSPITQDPKHKVSDNDFKKLVTVIRLAVPYTGMIITARESAQMRREAISLGCTQTDASTRIGIGAYSDRYTEQEKERQQFLLGDTRSLDDVIREFAEMGYITSFCTAGYRCGRTGKCIMDLLRTGKEGRFCKLNAVLTFREWLDDFGSKETKIAGEKIINKEIEEVKKLIPEFYPKLMEYYKRVENGERDIYF
ncbi:[FeFe] hydrogenase H-cluster radical SAM maturase HydG [bacterium]|nr:[FeFe] hydrogenase H-cluster radical SAM maturase HydG [bacterium]